MKRKLLALIILLVVLVSALVIVVPTMAGAPVCNPGDAGYNAAGDLQGSLVPSSYKTGMVSNKSQVCAYKVGIASYKKYHATDIASQELFAFTYAVVAPGQVLGPDVLKVALPACATQVDLFFGDVIPSFAGGLRYNTPGNNRLLAAKHVGTTLCTPPVGGQGCTLGYWKNHLASWAVTGYTPTQKVVSVFSKASLYPSLANATLLDALNFNGGPSATDKAGLLIKQGVAGVLSANHPGVNDYPLTAAQVINAVNSALASGNVTNILSNQQRIDNYNNLGCKLR